MAAGGRVNDLVGGDAGEARAAFSVDASARSAARVRFSVDNSRHGRTRPCHPEPYALASENDAAHPRSCRNRPRCVESAMPNLPSRIAVMGGSYGNVPALQPAWITPWPPAAASTCSSATRSAAAVTATRFWTSSTTASRSLAGNHEQQAAAGADTCGCGYDSAEDEKWGCAAFALSVQSLGEPHRKRIADWPDEGMLATPPATCCSARQPRSDQ